MSGHVGAMADRPAAPMKLKSTEFYELVRAIGRFFFIDAFFFFFFSQSLFFSTANCDFPLCHRERFCAKISLRRGRGHFCAVPGGGWSRFDGISSHQNENIFLSLSLSLARARSSILRLLVFIHSRARNDATTNRRV